MDKYLENIDMKWHQIGLLGRSLCLHLALLSSDPSYGLSNMVSRDGGGPGTLSGPTVPGAGCISRKEAVASKTGCTPRGRLTGGIAPGGAVVDLSKSTLDSVHTELARVWSLGRLYGSSILIRLGGEKERGKPPSNSRASDSSLTLKDPRTQTRTGQP